MSNTISEDIFEVFCSTANMRFDRIPTSDYKKTPDYDIFPSNVKIVVEVKQIDPNPEEQEEIEKFNNGESAMGSCTPGQRVRKQITKAGPQIKARAKGEHPSLLIVYDNVIIGSHTEPYMIRVAMYGLETHVIGVPKNYEFDPYLKDKKFGSKRKMTEEHNTSISAVGVIKQNPDNEIELRVYHNIHAAIPLNPDIMRFPSTYHYTLGEKELRVLQGWAEV